jgi:hypothetical protein
MIVVGCELGSLIVVTNKNIRRTQKCVINILSPNPRIGRGSVVVTLLDMILPVYA